MISRALVCLCLAASVVRSAPTTPTTDPSRLQRRLTLSGEVPSYVYTYAPIVYLHSDESYWPSDLSTHLSHLQPELNGTFQLDPNLPNPPTLQNLNASIFNQSVFLTSYGGAVEINSTAAWLNSDYGKPDSNGKSSVSIAIVLADKSNVAGPGTLDAFYFYFYSYNKGPNVLGQTFGNHVGDWEYSMLRFINGTPSAIFDSAHSDGEVFTYSALQKENGRPVTYSAIGTHANYAVPGTHNISAGISLVQDFCDAGHRWDVVATAPYVFWFNNGNQTFVAATGTNQPSEWLQSDVYWGDQTFPTSDPRQEDILGFERFEDGPLGPIDKSLGRVQVAWDTTLPTQTVLPAVVSGLTQSQAAALARGDSIALTGRLPTLSLIFSLVLAPSLIALIGRLR